MIADVSAINSDQKSSKSELSSRFFSRLKISAIFWRPRAQQEGGEGGVGKSNFSSFRLEQGGVGAGNQLSHTGPQGVGGFNGVSNLM